MYSAFHSRTTHQYLLSYDYRSLSYELLNLITLPLSGTIIAHVTRRMSNNCACSLCHFHGATTRTKPCY